MAKYIEDFRVGDDVKLTINCGENITNFTFWFTMKKAFSDLDADAVLQISSVAGSVVGDVLSTGIKIINIPSNLTKDIPPGSYFYDIQIVKPGNIVNTIIPPIEDYKDKILVIPQVTKRNV